MTTTTTFEKVLATILYVGYIAMAASVYIFLVPRFMMAGNMLIGVGFAVIVTICVYVTGMALRGFLRKPAQVLD